MGESGASESEQLESGTSPRRGSTPRPETGRGTGCYGFDTSVWPILAVVVATTLLAAGSVIAHVRLLGPTEFARPRHRSALLSVPFLGAALGLAAVAVRRDDVTLDAVGFGRTAFLPGVAAFAAFWLATTAVGLGYLTASGETTALGFRTGLPWYWTLVWFLLTLTVSNGLTEELVFRGFVQNKCAAIAREWGSAGRVSSVVGRERATTAVSVLAASLLFGVPHLPLAFIAYDASLASVPWVLLGNLLPGIVFGLVYVTTRNGWYVAFVHGFANAPVVPFEVGAVPAFRLIAGTLGLLVAVAYRRLRVGNPRTPTVLQSTDS